MTDLSKAIWRKSSRSSGTGGNCVEVATNLVGTAQWRKSSRSTGQGGNCVEVAANLPGVVAVRDSKDPGGPVFVLRPAAWVAFAEAVKGGRLDG